MIGSDEIVSLIATCLRLAQLEPIRRPQLGSAGGCQLICNQPSRERYHCRHRHQATYLSQGEAFVILSCHNDPCRRRRLGQACRHVAFLKRLIDAGQVRVSGPVTGLGKRAGFIIMTLTNIEEARALIEQDPFSVEGLIDELTIVEWTPMFGSLDGTNTTVPG